MKDTLRIVWLAPIRSNSRGMATNKPGDYSNFILKHQPTFLRDPGVWKPQGGAVLPLHMPFATQNPCQNQKKHAENRNFVESILRRIPGFRGYLEKEYRRESDELQRKWLADRLGVAKSDLDRLSQKLVDAVRIDDIPKIDRLRNRLEKLIGRIAGAVQGYSGVFDLVRIDESVLDKVYDHDVTMMELTEKTAAAVESLSPSDPDLSTSLDNVIAQVDALDNTFNAREQILKGLD